MNRKSLKLVIIVALLVLSLSIISAATSENYAMESVIVSSGTQSDDSNNFMTVVIDFISGLVNSTNYIIKSGFAYTIGAADFIPPILYVFNITALDNESISTQFNATDRNGIDSWWLNDTNFTITKDVGENATFRNATILTSGLYYVTVSVNDTEGNTNSSVIQINITESNILPVVTLVYPVDTNITNRTPTLNWTCSDANGDNCTSFEINITAEKVTGFFICSDVITASPSTEEYTPTILECLNDYGYIYNWKVRANDGIGWGEWAESTFNLTAFIDIIILVNELNFGEVDPWGTPNDTIDDNPLPLVIQNDGNSLVNISHNATQLWNTESTASEYFQIKVDNKTGEEGAFTWLSSITSWISTTITGEVTIIDKLDYVDSQDSAEIDIKVKVPQAEYPGNKSSIITFFASLAEDYPLE